MYETRDLFGDLNIPRTASLLFDGTKPKCMAPKNKCGEKDEEHESQIVWVVS